MRADWQLSVNRVIDNKNFMNDYKMTLYPARKDGKSGYINSSGQIIIDFIFDFFGNRRFSEGLASVEINGKAGFIDTNGNMVINPKFDMAMPFSEGFAYVEFQNKRGYIDKTGQFVIEPQYYSCDSFFDGYALVKNNVTSKGFFIDKQGNVKLQGRNFLISKYREGLINCPDGKGNWGFIDIEDNIIIDFNYKTARGFYEGKGAVVPKKDLDGNPNRKEKYGFINHQNELIINPVFQGTNIKFSEGLCAVWDNGYGYINDMGILTIPYEYELGTDFKEGFAAFNPKGKNKGYGFIDKSGNIIVQPKYKHVDDFNNGLSEVIVGTEYENFKYGYINQKGEEIWEPRR